MPFGVDDAIFWGAVAAIAAVIGLLAYAVSDELQQPSFSINEKISFDKDEYVVGEKINVFIGFDADSGGSGDPGYFDVELYQDGVLIDDADRFTVPTSTTYIGHYTFDATAKDVDTDNFRFVFKFVAKEDSGLFNPAEWKTWTGEKIGSVKVIAPLEEESIIDVPSGGSGSIPGFELEPGY